MFYFNEEGKVRINLSNHAYSVMENDMLSFQTKEKATFLNIIIRNFHGKAQASYVTNILAQKENEWKLVLDKISDLRQCLDEEKIRKKKIDLKQYSDAAIREELKQNYIKMIIKAREKPEKGSNFTFRINNQNRSMLEEAKEADLEDLYYSPQDYIKALMEEYANLSYYSREAIFYQDIMEDIQMYIDTNKLIEIQKGNAGKISGSKKEEAIQIVPYRIMSDKAKNYHYLIGVQIRKGVKSYISFRISDIQGVRKKRAITSEEKLSSMEKKELNQLLVEKGAAFIGMPSTYSIVRLTSKGINMYRKMLFLRPAYVKIYNQNEYLFDCTTKQLEFYFFKFGKEAVIIGPSGIRSQFKKSYDKAYHTYEQDPDMDDAAFRERIRRILNS